MRREAPEPRKTREPRKVHRVYDVCVVGGGVAGLYAAWRLRQLRPEWRVCVLEAADRLGGRVGTFPWAGRRVVAGAGVGRPGKDVLLERALRGLGLSWKPFPHDSDRGTGVPDVDLMDVLRKLRAVQPRQGDTFRSFATRVLGKELYDAFKVRFGYTDYEAADAAETLAHYGFDEELRRGGRYALVPWDELIAGLRGPTEVLTGAAVTGVDARPDGTFRVAVASKRTVVARKVVLAAPASGIRDLGFRKAVFGVRAQPFVRVYARLSGVNVRKYTVVCPPLQKIIPMGGDRYMAAYADNASAVRLHRALQDPDAGAKLARYIEKALALPRGSVTAEDVRVFFFREGTHYFAPDKTNAVDRDDQLHAAQRPAPGVFAVGEALSRQQGWVEGALASVEAVLDDIAATPAEN